MAEILIRLPEIEKTEFENRVGKGKMTSTIRQFIKSLSIDKDNIDETLLRKKFAFIEEDKKKIDLEYIKLKSKIEEIDNKKKNEEIEKLKKLKKMQDKQNEAEYQTMKQMMSELV